jgi:predicted Rossmann fold nucleotide-binding protein DprA/Smf involved in DNA uptake
MPELNETEKKTLQQLEAGESTIDALAEALDLSAGVVSATLLQLEMKSLIKQLPGKYFTKLI